MQAEGKWNNTFKKLKEKKKKDIKVLYRVKMSFTMRI